MWSDTELVRYLNEAHVQFARRTHCLIDDTSDFTTFDTVVGQQSYTLDQRIIFIGEAGLVITNEDGTKTYYDLRDGARHSVRKTFRAGRPVQLTAQVARHTVRLSPVPDAVYTVVMSVARKPLYNMANGSDNPEIDEDYQLALCDYAAWRALTNNDPDGANMASAKTFRGQWDLHVRDAKRDIARLWAGANAQARSNWTGKTR